MLGSSSSSKPGSRIPTAKRPEAGLPSPGHSRSPHMAFKNAHPRASSRPAAPLAPAGRLCEDMFRQPPPSRALAPHNSAHLTQAHTRVHTHMHTRVCGFEGLLGCAVGSWGGVRRLGGRVGRNPANHHPARCAPVLTPHITHITDAHTRTRTRMRGCGRLLWWVVASVAGVRGGMRRAVVVGRGFPVSYT